jgi:hypothetical protein
MAYFRTCYAALAVAACLAAQTTPPPPDTLVFTDGEKLIGHFERSNGSTVTFKSDSVGEVNVDWSKIQELHTSGPFAVAGKDIKLSRHSDLAKVPRGALTVSGKTLTVTPAAGASVQMPLADASHIIDLGTFDKDLLNHPGFLQDWKGTAAAGASLVQATQQSQTFTGSISLVRAMPPESWMDPRNRTIFDFSASSGHLTQPGTPSLKTQIVHADAERDQYFRGKAVYAFGQAAFDHNYSQGLQLQQNYGGGIGWTVIDHPNTTFDIKGSATYMRQQFEAVPGIGPAGADMNLIGSTFAEDYLRKIGKKGIRFTENLAVLPAWNNTHAYSANAKVGLAIPVYKRLGFGFTMADMFLNDPPHGFKKNSFQLTTALTYSFQ